VRAARRPAHFRLEPAVRRNFLWAALNGALFEAGASFADAGTVVVTFLGRLTPGALAVGAAATIARFGWLLPQLFTANYARGLRHRKPIYLVAGGGRALCLGLLAVALLAWPGTIDEDSSVLLLVVFFILWTAFSFVAGLAGVPYNDVIARTIPSDWRSRLLGVRVFVGGALAAAGGLLVRAILSEAPGASVRPYGLIFGVGAGVLALSTGCFSLIREPPAPVEPARPGFRVFLREGLKVLHHDHRFRLFLYAQLLGGVTKMAAPFYVVQAQRLSRVPELEVGTLLAAQMVGGIVLNPLWGSWGDRRGKLSLLKVLTGVGAVSPLLALLLPFLELTPLTTLAAYAVVFFFLGASTTGEIVADLGYLMEISPDERRPEYTGYMNALVAPSRLLPFLGGVIVSFLSFRVLFVLAAAGVAARLGVLGQLARLPAPSVSRTSGTAP
jgi:MFS family permease